MLHRPLCGKRTLLRRVECLSQARIGIVYVVIAVPVLLWLCLVTGPFQGSDEVEHFFRAVQLSEGHLLPVRSPTRAAAGDYLDPQLVKLGGYYEYVGRYRPNQPFGSGAADRATAWRMKPSRDVTFADFSNTVIYFPLAHAVPAVGIGFMRVIGAPIIAWLYAGRLIDAALSVMLFVIAFRLLPEGQLLLFALALLPRALFTMASISADALLIPVSALFGALLFRLAADGELSSKRKAVLAAATFLLAVNKLAYLPLIAAPPMIALLSRRRFNETTRYFLLTSALTFLVWAAWMLAISGSVFTIRHDGVHVDVYAQFHHVLRDPLRFTSVLLRSAYSGIFFDLNTLVAGDIGGAGLKGADVMFPKPLAIATLAALVMASVTAPTRLTTNWPALILVFALSVVVTIVIFLMIYMQFNAVDAPTIVGFQGRYLLPLVAFTGALLPKLVFSEKGSKAVGLGLVAWFGLTSFETARVIGHRYWNPQQAAGLDLRSSRHVNLEDNPSISSAGGMPATALRRSSSSKN